ncbi:hypothetical protein AB0C10_16150 [Microbispora amethystogenes]|uniref:hypothetical protein n=1 Tax=Microbispora amethystogenes TaxID=1427754 RepID=UPI0033C3A934
MITPFDVLLAVYGLGVAYHLPRSRDRLVLLTNCNPTELCGGCRDERRRVMHEGMEWEAMFGDFAGPFMVLLDALAWYVKPLLPALQRSMGREPRAKCSKGECLAWTSRKAAA